MRLMILTILTGSSISEDYKGTLEGPLMRTDVRVEEGGFCCYSDAFSELSYFFFSFRLGVRAVSQLFS